MSIEVGNIVSGKVSGITNFGAFIDLEDHKTGLVHISQISNNFVKDIHDVLATGDEVKVKVMSIGDDGKIALSIKATEAPKPASEHSHSRPKPQGDNGRPAHHENRRPTSHVGSSNNRGNASKDDKSDFDSLLSGFLKESESRLSTLRHNTEGKRGGRGGRRS